MIGIETKSGLSLEEMANEGIEVPDEKYRQRFVLMPIDELCKRAKLDNYREHTITGTNRLSGSIQTRGLLEPILLSFNTKTNEISLIDGEGRFWSCYRLDAKYVPVIIYYEVSEEDRIEMKIAANAMKTPIASDDLAVYSARLRELLQEYKDKQSEDFEKTIGINGRRYKNVTINELAGVMGKNRKTVSNYLVFSRLPEKILGYVRKHPGLNYYSRAVKIGRRVRESEQVEFFDNVIRLEEEKREKERMKREKEEEEKKIKKIRKEKKEEEEWSRISNLEFNELLRSRILREPGVLLSRQNGNPDEEGRKIKELIVVSRTAERYARAFNDFFIYNEEFRGHIGSAKFQTVGEKFQTTDTNHVNVTEFIESLLERWNWIHSKLDEEIRDKVLDYFGKPIKLRFDEEILLEVQRRRQGDFVPDYKIIKPVCDCDEISIIPLDKLRSVRNIRTRISEDRINALAQEIKNIGQLKPGLVVDRGDYYQIVYGHTRVRALERAGHKNFKAFVSKGLSDLEIELLQCHEDLSEQDKPGERARVLSLYYELKAKLNGTSYTQENFVRDFKHLASRKSLLNSLRFMELDDLTRNFSILGLVGYGSAIEIGRLEPDKRMDVLYSALVHPYTRDIKRMVDRKLAEENQFNLFSEIPRSYESIFKEFGMQSMSPFLKIGKYFGRDDDFSKAIRSDEKLYLNFAKFSQQLEKVKNTIRDYKNE